MDIQTKDGILLRGIPDGTPEEVIKARLAEIRGGNPQEKPQQQAQSNLSDKLNNFDTELSFSEKLAQNLPDSWADNGGGKIAGFVQGAADPSVGIAQLGANIVGLGGKVNPAIKIQNAGYESARTQQGRDGFDWSRLAGNIASPVNMLAAKFLPQAPTSGGGAIKQGAGIGGAFAAMNPVTNIPEDKSYFGEKAKQVGIGAGTGGLVSGSMYGLANVLAPKASAEWQKLKDAGVNTTIGQRLGGILNATEEKAQSLPFVGGFISNARQNSLDDWNNATINKTLEPIGERVTGSGHEAVKEASQKLSNAIQKGESMLGGFKLDDEAVTGLSQIEEGVKNASNLTPIGKKGFNEALALVKQNISPNGSILAEGYNELNSKLTQLASRYKGSPDAYQQNLGDAIAQLQSVIKDSAMRANPEAADLINRAKAGYAASIRVEGATKAAASNKLNTGVFTPAQLMQAVRSADTSVRDRATSHGDALLQDWAQTGLKVLGDKVPNSGTFDRAANGAALVGLLTQPQMIPPAIAGTAATAGIYSKTGQKLLNKLATDRPEIALKMAEILKKSAPFAGLPLIYPALQANE